MGKFGGMGARNHGYGKQMAYAGRQALQDRHGGGAFRTQHDQAQRWAQFAEWAKEQGVKDARQVDQDLVRAYGSEMVDRGLSPATAHNAVSAVNTVMTTLRDGKWETVSPADATGMTRHSVRTEAPSTTDRQTVTQVGEALREAGLSRAAAVLDLARGLGVRMEEAAKADLSRLDQEARHQGAINIQEGTKGGRDAARWVPITPAARQAIDRAVQTRPEGSRNLIAPGETWRDLREGELRAAREVLHAQGVPGYHDARAAYAVERYQELAGARAPAVAGSREVDKATDRQARAQIAHELGHGRVDVTSAYLGSSR